MPSGASSRTHSTSAQYCQNTERRQHVRIVYTSRMPSASERTLFEKIVERQIPAQIVYQDDEITAFRDVNPVAPIHILVVPNKPIRTLNDATTEDERLLGRMLLTAQRLAHEIGIADDGYRIVMNCNSQGGQSVFHLHFHLLGGRKMTWPPG